MGLHYAFYVPSELLSLYHWAFYAPSMCPPLAFSSPSIGLLKQLRLLYSQYKWLYRRLTA